MSRASLIGTVAPATSRGARGSVTSITFRPSASQTNP
jgi:hypothetical protein